MNMKITGGFAVYDCPPLLKAFLTARDSGTFSKEELVQLAAAAETERLDELAKKPKAQLIDFTSALRERNEPKVEND